MRRWFTKVEVGTRFRDRDGSWNPRPWMMYPWQNWLWHRTIPLQNWWGRMRSHVTVERPLDPEAQPMRFRGWEYALVKLLQRLTGRRRG